MTCFSFTLKARSFNSLVSVKSSSDLSCKSGNLLLSIAFYSNFGYEMTVANSSCLLYALNALVIHHLRSNSSLLVWRGDYHNTPVMLCFFMETPEYML